VRDHLLRTEATSNHVRDFGVPKAIEAVPHVRETMSAVTDRYLTVQQDILETFLDRGQLRPLAAPTQLANGKRIPGLKLDRPRLLAVMQARGRFAQIAGGDTFTTKALHPAAAAALDSTTEQYRLASLRYDLSKRRAKRLVEKVEPSRRYRLLPQGYRLCVLFLKLFERVYAPLTAGVLRPVAADAALEEEKRHRLCISQYLDQLRDRLCVQPSLHIHGRKDNGQAEQLRTLAVDRMLLTSARLSMDATDVTPL
jgi:hypothetical protein